MSYLVTEARKLNLLEAVNAARGSINYRGYNITYWAKPIPDRRWDWDFISDEFCGDGDNRYGAAASLGAAMAEIDEQIAGEA